MGRRIPSEGREDRNPGDLRAGLPRHSIIPSVSLFSPWIPVAAFARDRECVLPAITGLWLSRRKPAGQALSIDADTLSWTQVEIKPEIGGQVSQ